MGLMAVYLSLSTLEDPDIVDTVMTALGGADDRGGVHIGIAATVGDNFYKEILAPLETINNVAVTRLDPIAHRGIGYGRNSARFAYDDEDYILQVDSHTNFLDGWDTSIVNTYLRAKEEVDGPVLITGYLAPHIKRDGIVLTMGLRPRYSVYVDRNIRPRIRLKEWMKFPISDFPKQYHGYIDMEFIPANKIGANFTLGDRSWSTESGLPKETVFWEEEVVQSINLLESGFSLVFPNVDIPLTHRYYGEGEDLTRQAADRLYDSVSIIDNKIAANLERFIIDNPDACSRYAVYSGYDLATTALSGKIIPDSYDYR